VTDTHGVHDWAMPAGAGEPSVGQVPDAAPSAAVPPPPAPAQYLPPVVPAAPAVTHAPTYRSWQPGIIPLRPVGFGEFLSVPFRAMRFNRSVVVGGPTLCVTLSMVLLGAAFWIAFTDPSLALLSPSGQISGIQTSTVVVMIVAFLALILADAIASAIVAPGVARAVLGERITIGAALRTIGPRIWSLALVWLMSTLAVGAAMVPGIVLMMVSFSNGDDATAILGSLTLIGFAVLAALPIYVISAVARCVIVLEKRGPFSALRRTFQVIKGRFWWSLLIVFVTGLIIYTVTGIFQQMMSFVGGIVLAIGFNGGWWAMAVFVAALVVGAIIAYVVTYSYMGAVYALIYIDARIRHEGFDLDLARAAEARRA